MMRTTTPILSILVAVLLFVFFTHPEYEAIKVKQKEIAEYQEAKDKYQTFMTNLNEKSTKKQNRLGQEMERLDRLVPSGIDATQHLVDLEALAKRHNLLFGNIEVQNEDLALGESEGGEVSRDDLIAVDISFEVVGTYEKFKTFLTDLERSLTLFEVTNLTFDVVDGPFQQFGVAVRTYAHPGSN